MGMFFYQECIEVADQSPYHPLLGVPNHVDLKEFVELTTLIVLTKGNTLNKP